MGDIRIETLTNADPRFYPLLGPYLSRREIIKELGCPIYDEDGKVWFVALDGEQVVGFVGVRFEGDKAVFCSDYIRPEYRRQGVYTHLMAVRLTYVQDKASSASAVVTTAARRTYERHGFTATKTLKNYVKMSRSLP